MQLNMNCVRDILLCVEENTGLRKMCAFYDVGKQEVVIQEALGHYNWSAPVQDYQAKLLSSYDNETLLYHINYCVEAGLIKQRDPAQNRNRWAVITDLTVDGHELVGTIRDSRNWGLVEKGMSAVRAYSLDVIKAIAEGVASASINAFVAKLSL